MSLIAKWIRHNQGRPAALLIAVVLLVVTLAGCQRGDFRLSMVMQGQQAPHAGYNIGPNLYLEPGDPVPVSGAVVWIRGLDPNDLR